MPFYFSGQFVDPFRINIRISLTKKPLGYAWEVLDTNRMFQDDEFVRRAGIVMAGIFEASQKFYQLEQDLKKMMLREHSFNPLQSGIRQLKSTINQDPKMSQVVLRIAN